MYSSLVPAKETIFKGETAFAYQCAEDQNAAIHAGYILGLPYCADDDQLKDKYFVLPKE